jgi:hypothetical protein
MDYLCKKSPLSGFKIQLPQINLPNISDLKELLTFGFWGKITSPSLGYLSVASETDKYP